MGPCLCGDTHCPSCGPAQGNFKCPICGSWADDCCEHFTEEGTLKPEFEALAQEKEAAEAKYWDDYAKSMENEDEI